MLVSDLIDEFLIDCRSRRLAPKTIAWYGANLRYFREWLAREGQADSLASFTLANGRRYSRWLSERTARRGTFLAQGGKRGAYAPVETDAPLAANTAFGYLRTLKTFSRWLAAEEQGYTARDVLAGLKLPKRPKAREEPLTEEEMGQLLDGYDLRAPIANRDFAILLTYLGTGLRATELTNLLLDDVHGEGISDPLGEPFTLAALWDDLARLAGERPPAAVRRLHDADGPSITPQRPEGGLAPGLVRATKPARVISSP